MTVKGLLSEELVMERLKDVFDPEIHMSIVELGLVYGVDITDEGIIDVTYTLTSPGCPLGARHRWPDPGRARRPAGREGSPRQAHVLAAVGPAHDGQRRREDAAWHLVGAASLRLSTDRLSNPQSAGNIAESV